MSTNKSLNYIDNQNTSPTAAGKALDKESFSIGAIFDILNEVRNNNQHINTIAEETNAESSVKEQSRRYYDMEIKPKSAFALSKF